MKTAGNISLGFAFLLLIYHLIPNLPALREAIMRSNNGPLGAAYMLGFVLVPQFLRMLIATLAMWSLLIVALVAAVRFGGLDWIGISRLSQCLLIGAACFAMTEISVLIGAACFAMTEISVLIGLTYNDPNFSIPKMVSAISPWAGWALPVIVMGFTLVTINPSLARFISPWACRAPLIAAFALSLPIGAILLVRWFKPEASVAVVSQ